MNSRKLFTELVLQVKLSEPVSEINEKVLMLLEHKLRLSKAKILVGSPVNFTPQLDAQLRRAISRINNQEPIQYISGHAEFYGRKFKVNSSVLIPRPETEELVHHALSLIKSLKQPAILDIGTGSGCIAVTVGLELHQPVVYATDISKKALVVAQRNALKYGANVFFMHHDILTEQLPHRHLDLVISNPPYIGVDEKATLQPGVLHHEPHEALFAGGNDPLIFYRMIATKGKTALKPGGHMLVEINECMGPETAAIFLNEGYENIRIMKDISGNDRIIVASNK